MSSVQLQVLAQILGKADAAMVRNRFSVGQETPVGTDLQPTITAALTTAPTSTYTKFYDAASIHSSANKIAPKDAPWTTYGGDPAVHSGSGSISGVMLDVCTRDISTTPHTLHAQNGVFEFVLTDNSMIVKFEQNHDFRVYVEDDGVMKIAIAGIGAGMQTGTGWAYMTVDFGGSNRKDRKIWIQPLIRDVDTDPFTVGLFGGIYVKDDAQIISTRIEQLRVAVMHDSLGQGRHGPSADSLWNVVFESMGIRDIRNASVGATGAISRMWPDANGNALGYYSDRRNDIIGNADGRIADLTVLAASWNDYDTAHALGWTGSSGLSSIVEAMRQEILAYRAANKDMIVVVTGLYDSAAYYAYNETDAPDMNAAIAAMVAVFADPSIFFLDLSTMYEGGPWIGLEPHDNGGTGTGNYSRQYADNVGHPQPYGDYSWGKSLANRLVEALEALNKVTVGDYIPPPVTYGNWTHVVYENDTPNTFTVTASSGVAYRFGNAGANQWSPDTFLSPGTYTANYTTWPTDPSPGNVKEVQIGTPV